MTRQEAIKKLNRDIGASEGGSNREQLLCERLHVIENMTDEQFAILERPTAETAALEGGSVDRTGPSLMPGYGNR